MIYGLNFGAPDIPEGYRRKFAGRIQIKTLTPEVAGRHYVQGEHGYALLVGTATERPEMLAMLIQATNGNRTLFVVERKTSAGIWFGIYAY